MNELRMLASRMKQCVCAIVARGIFGLLSILCCLSSPLLAIHPILATSAFAEEEATLIEEKDALDSKHEGAESELIEEEVVVPSETPEQLPGQKKLY